MNVIQILNGINANLGMGLVITATTIISSTAAYKLANDIPVNKIPLKSENGIVSTITPTENSVDGTITPEVTFTVVPTTVGTSVIGGATFDATNLASHNKPGNCYVAYAGKVYDVSNHSSWLSCWHHGIAGGQDITNKFPHSTSYLSTLKIVGTYTGPVLNGGSKTDDDDNEQENEQENHKEDNKQEVENEREDD
jgi:predicted heme/steroid binding protein